MVGKMIAKEFMYQSELDYLITFLAVNFSLSVSTN
jgi:hypothetical protein